MFFAWIIADFVVPLSELARQKKQTQYTLAATTTRDVFDEGREKLVYVCGWVVGFIYHLLAGFFFVHS